MNYACTIHYTGQLDADKVKTLLEKNIPIAKTGKKAKVVFPNIKKPKENIIYFVQDKKAVQSQVYFYVPGNKYSNEQYIAKNGFNTYFGDGFSGLVLQEIREYRSLAYSAWGRYFNFDTSPNKSAFLWAYIGCQADKTIEAIEVMNDLLKNLPEKKERLTNIRSNLKLKAQSAYPGFRKVSQSIEAYKEQGFDDDPNRKAVVAYDKMSFEDIMDFYQKNIKGKAITIAIYGNKKKINLEKLKAFGKLVELDKKEIRKE
ncbi:MAG TPA: insulinase family protein [Saprospiraceae bacterium]|nr:insulinase family protein [Saprospiraceae bacterium]